MTNTVIDVPGVKLEGQFVAQVYNIFSKKTCEEIIADNMLLDGFYNSWLGSARNSDQYFDYCDLDGSSTPVAAGDTTITKVGPARASYNGEEALQTLGVGQWKSGRQYVFAVATAPAAVNALTIWSANSGEVMAARANLPSTLNLIVGDILTVKHYITATVDPADRTGIMVLDGNNYPYTMRWLNFDGPFETALNHGTPWNVNTNGNYNVTGASQGIATGGGFVYQTQALPSINATPGAPDFPATSGDSSGVYIVTPAAYTPGSFYRDIQITLLYGRFNTPAGIGNIIFPLYNMYSPTTGFFINFASARVPKNNTNEFRITLRFTWGR
jgi:hypothetical protein